MSTIPTQENLKRVIGVRALVLAILNITVGSGIFVIPALIADGLGAAAVLAYLVCGLLIFLIALCFAELGSKTTESGGVYTYIGKAFGPFAGFIANNIFWLGGCVVSDAALANALADTLGFFFPSLITGPPRIIFLVFIFASLALLNIRSAKGGIRLVEIAGLGKLIPLVIIVLLSARFMIPGNLHWVTVPTVRHVGSASLLLFYAFIGLETPLSNGGEIRNPRRTVPLGVLFGVAAVLLLYVCIQWVTQGVLGDTMVLHKDAPLAAVASISLGKIGGILVIAISALAMLGSLGGEILSIPRILFAGARDGLLPGPLGRVHPAFNTPHVAIIVYSLLGSLLAVSGGFKQLAILSSAAVLLIYLGVVLASVRLRTKASTATGSGFRVPGGPVLPILASVGIIWLLSNLAAVELIYMGIFIAILSAIWFFLRLWKKRAKAILN